MNIDTLAQALSATSYRYSITRRRDDIDYLRVETDNYTTNTTTVVHIPLLDVEKAIAQYKAGLHPIMANHVRISSEPDKLPVGCYVSVSDAETGESIENCFRAVITLDAGGANMAELTMYDDKQPYPAGGPTKTKTMLVEKPEVDLTAFGVRAAGGRG